MPETPSKLGQAGQPVVDQYGGVPTRVTVVIPTYRRSARMQRLLLALGEQTVPPEQFKVVIVDDHSDDGTVEQITALLPRLPYHAEVVVAASNGGPGPARNLGWRRATTSLLAFIDDDCVPDRGWLAAGVAALEADPGVGVLQGRTVIPRDHVPGSLPRWHHSQIILGPTVFFQACNIFYRRDALQAAGGFDEGLARWGEDSAAAWAAIEAGWRSGFSAEATVAHDLEARGVGWYIRSGLANRTVVDLACRYPGYRRALWRPWAMGPGEVAFLAAAIGVVAGARLRPALALVVPWALLRRPSVRQPEFFRILAEHAAVDGAGLLGSLAGSLRHHCLIL